MTDLNLNTVQQRILILLGVFFLVAFLAYGSSYIFTGNSCQQGEFKHYGFGESDTTFQDDYTCRSVEKYKDRLRRAVSNEQGLYIMEYAQTINVTEEKAGDFVYQMTQSGVLRYNCAGWNGCRAFLNDELENKSQGAEP